MTENNNVPMLRFAGFFGDWEQRYLEEICEIYSGLTYSPNDIVDAGGTLVLRSSNVKDGEIVDADNVYVKSEVVNCENVAVGDVVVVVRNGSRNLIGKHGLVKMPMQNTVVGAFMSGLRPTTQPDFFNALLDTPLFDFAIAQNLGATINQITNGMFKQMSFATPSDESEQTAIGDFFRSLDDTIALKRREHEKMLNIKKAMLNKMFPKDGAGVPEIRFDGFTEPWESRPLTEITERITRKNANLETDLPLTISAQFGLVDQRDFFNHQVASRNIGGYFLLLNGEFAYNKSYSNGYPWGAVKRLDKHDMGALSTLYICFKSTDVVSEYLVYYYETHLWHKEVEKIAAEGARNHGLLNIPPLDFFKTVVIVPSTEKEQIAIGEFFRSIDSLLDTQREELATLQNIKTVCLNKMFV